MIDILILLILCATVLLVIYMIFCAENNTGLFEPIKYRNKIRSLESAVQKLTKEIKELKEKT